MWWNPNLIRYKGLLFGDISAVCAVLRVPYLQQLLENTVRWKHYTIIIIMIIILQDLHDRLVYGSDYPVPAINVVVHTSRLQRYVLIVSFPSCHEYRTVDKGLVLSVL